MGRYKRHTSLFPAWSIPFTSGFPRLPLAASNSQPAPFFPAWKNNLLVGFLKHQQIVRLVLDGHDVVKEEVILRESGRVRDIRTGPDGALYVLIDHRGMILRLTPVKRLKVKG